MDLTGKHEIPATPQEVWEALNDPQILAACVPGCDNLDKTTPTDFVVSATLKIGPVKATFKGKITLSELDPPRRCMVRGEGQGGAAGFARGQAEVLLTENGSATVLTYAAKAAIGGKLAQIGQRLIDGAARQIADEFFGRFAAVLTERRAAAEPPAMRDGGGEAAPQEETMPRPRRFPAKLWIGIGAGAVIAAAAAVAYLFASRR